jgi:hypothetical protein
MVLHQEVVLPPLLQGPYLEEVVLHPWRQDPCQEVVLRPSRLGPCQEVAYRQEEALHPSQLDPYQEEASRQEEALHHPVEEDQAWVEMLACGIPSKLKEFRRLIQFVFVCRPWLGEVISNLPAKPNYSTVLLVCFLEG